VEEAADSTEEERLTGPAVTPEARRARTVRERAEETILRRWKRRRRDEGKKERNEKTSKERSSTIRQRFALPSSSRLRLCPPVSPSSPSNVSRTARESGVKHPKTGDGTRWEKGGRSEEGERSRGLREAGRGARKAASLAAGGGRAMRRSSRSGREEGV
jgi:hypothetical protein